jgi:hypothetical protein
MKLQKHTPALDLWSLSTEGMQTLNLRSRSTEGTPALDLRSRAAKGTQARSAEKRQDRKRAALWAALLFSCVVAFAQDTLDIRQAFKAMPDSVVPYLSTNNRLDFIDFVDSDMRAEVTNAFNGHSLMTALTADSLSLQLNESTRLDMLLLPIEGEAIDSCHYVIAVTFTYSAAPMQPEPSLSFFSAKWRELPQEPPLTAAARRRIHLLAGAPPGMPKPKP